MVAEISGHYLRCSGCFCGFMEVSVVSLRLLRFREVSKILGKLLRFHRGF